MARGPQHIGIDSLSVTSSAAIGLTQANIPPGTQSAEIYTPQEIHFWLNGTAPTTTTGLVAPANSIFMLISRYEIDGFKAIATSTTSALQISYRDS